MTISRRMPKEIEYSMYWRGCGISIYELEVEAFSFAIRNDVLFGE